MIRCIAILLFIFLSGCASLSYVNKECKIETGPPASKATMLVDPERGNADALVILALSGGGSRAAYLSSKVMLRLQDVFKDADLLQEVDAISSVSGGSLASAYYCFSINPGKYRVVKVFSNPKDEFFTDELKELQAENRLVYDRKRN